MTPRRGRPFEPLEVRFLRHVKKGQGCWTWTGAKSRKKPTQARPHMKVRRDDGTCWWVPAARVAKFLRTGDWGIGKVIGHTCGHSWCVNGLHVTYNRPARKP